MTEEEIIIKYDKSYDREKSRSYQSRAGLAMQTRNQEKLLREDSV